MTKTVFLLILSLLIFAGTIAQSSAETQAEITPRAYLPIIIGPPEYVCATSSSNTYISGTVDQHDTDNPVRPAFNHADKNIELRGYVANTDPNLRRDLVDYGSGDSTQPPQFATNNQPRGGGAFNNTDNYVNVAAAATAAASEKSYIGGGGHMIAGSSSHGYGDLQENIYANVDPDQQYLNRTSR